MPETPKKILVVRNDKLGDFMLAYPAFNVIKKTFPNAKVYALVPNYTLAMAQSCPWIDEVITDDTQSGLTTVIKMTRKIREQKFDACISLFIKSGTAISLYFSGIPYRFAPATKLAQIFFNKRLAQRRSRSSKPEYEYNVDLANYMGEFFGATKESPDGPPYLTFPEEQTARIKHQFVTDHNATENRKIVIIHPGTGGSASTISLDQYATLIQQLVTDSNIHIVITAGPGEEPLAKKLADLASSSQTSVYTSSQGLLQFAMFISIAELFISGSTGVLHIAGALDVPTVGFYPSRQSATSLRWQTLNSPARRLAFSPAVPYNENEMESIDMIDVHTQITGMLDRETSDTRHHSRR